MTGSSPGGLLAVHAHPDDETLATGALLATWADAGLPVTVVTCTRGELGEVIGPALAHLEGDGPALAAHRERELAAALEALGVTDHLFLDAAAPATGRSAEPCVASGVRFTDSGMAWAGVTHAGRRENLPDGAFVAVPLDDAAGRLARVLRDRRPAVVVTYEPGGGYGHPDHVRAHEVTARAVALAADTDWAPEAGPSHAVAAVLWAVRGEQSLRAAYRELAANPRLVASDLRARFPAPDGPVPSVAVPDGEVGLTVDVRPVLARLAAALFAHATQVKGVTIVWSDRDAPGAPNDVIGSYALSNDIVAPVLGVEEYRLAPGSSGDGVVWPAGMRRVA
ncbi:MAG: GlcNAc-PI de-N-acetylase [Cellulomonas sp.]|uniref:PIG-L family deacetylase n=1 Tax=Cellulomonas sp. TaxID=40001 RepID=UPI001835F75C|nr:PIG-L family deacetylase [Cellulomonas sp.]NMM17581.1 GlcNAc-PI de-N-acetylase [Cellulomonas sp.]NMM30594.1 GlcNAc-PI de-N-acetylase [Cellulomonas sp.]